MKISEIFYSVQGEGPETGKKAVFIRLAGCSLKCKFCDTKYAYRGYNLEKESIIKEIEKYRCKHIIWTGGEPTLQINGISGVINKLKKYKYSIETNGTFPFNTNLFSTIVISPKKQAINKELIKKYKGFNNVYFKFVVNKDKDYNFWIDLIKELKIPKKNIYFMPEAKDKKTLIQRSKWLIKKTKQDGFNFSNRLQIIKGFR